MIKELVLAGVYAAGAAGFCSVYFNTNKYDIAWGALLGSLGWVVFLFIQKTGGSIMYAYFLGAFVVALVSEVLAIVIKNPATVYLLPGLLPLVPGGGMFQTMRAAVNGNITTALSLGYATLGAAGAIALGIAIASSIARLFSKLIGSKH